MHSILKFINKIVKCPNCGGEISLSKAEEVTANADDSDNADEENDLEEQLEELQEQDDEQETEESESDDEFGPDAKKSTKVKKDKVTQSPAEALTHALLSAANKSSKQSIAKAKSGVWNATAKLAAKLSPTTANPKAIDHLAKAIKAERSLQVRPISDKQKARK
jgi:hypothetical protein